MNEPIQVNPQTLLTIIGEKEVEIVMLRAQLAQARQEIEAAKPKEEAKSD